MAEAFWFAGGIPKVQSYLREYLNLDVMTVTGKTLGENLDAIEESGFYDRYIGYLHNCGLQREDVIQKPDKAASSGSVIIMKGNLAPEAAVGGPLAYVKSGDIIEYDVKKKTIDVVGIQGSVCGKDEAQAILDERKSREAIKTKEYAGAIGRYTKMAVSAMEGAGY